MSRGINKVILIGYAGKDAESRYTSAGKQMASFSVATSESWNDKATGNKQERTEWHRLVAFDRTAEVATKFVRKGTQIYIEGKLQTREWQDKDGNKRTTTEILCQHIELLGPAPAAEDRPAKTQAKAAAQPQSETETQSMFPASDSSLDGDFDNDIPF